MQRDNLKLVSPAEDRALDRIRSAVGLFVDETTDQPRGTGNGAVRFQHEDPMAEPVMLAAIGAALATRGKGQDGRRSALTLDLYSFGLPETRRARIIQHAVHPQRPMWLASGIRDQRLALWIYAVCRAIVEDTARGRVFLEDLAEALHIPVRDLRILKQTLPLQAPAD